MQKNTTSFARLPIIIATGVQLLACSSPSSSEQVTHDDRAYFPKLNDSIAMAAVFKLVMDTAYIGAGPNHGEVSEVTPRWLWTAKFDSVMARYPMADISNPGKEPIRVFYAVQSSSKSDSLYKVEFTAELAEMQTSEGNLGTNSGVSTFRKKDGKWYLANTVYNSDLLADRQASAHQDKLVESLGKEREEVALTSNTNTGSSVAPADAAASVPNPAIDVTKLRYPIVVTEVTPGERPIDNDIISPHPAFVTFDGKVVDIDKSSRMSISAGNLHYILERMGNGSSLPIYTQYNYDKPSRFKIKREQHPYTSDPMLPTITWTLLDENNNYVTDYKKFPILRATSASPAQGSTISNVGENRFWVDCRNAGKGFLINEKGATLAAVNSFAITMAYTNGVLVTNNNTIIDRDGHILFQNDKFKVAYVIDDYVMLANDKSIPASTAPGENYVYINYRTGKVIYRGGDQEKKSSQL